MIETITVFEHQRLKCDEKYNNIEFTEGKLLALQKFYDKHDCYYSLIHRGVKFNQYVGVIKVGNTVYEILPKADQADQDQANWRDILIGMLKSVGLFTVKAPSHASLNLKSNNILDLYFEYFITEVEHLVHSGLVKKYHKKEGNTTALKGNLLFAKHIQQNLVHQERFYVRQTVYSVNHLLHQILYKTICLLKRINPHNSLMSRIGALSLDFPEMPNIKVTEATFDKIEYSRKTIAYQPAIDIAKLILLNYHPDLSGGRKEVLALMFDMNKLWETFVYVSLLKNKDADTVIERQIKKPFWSSADTRHRSSLQPDIVVTKGNESFVIDTKWKLLEDKSPSSSDLQQMYAYARYYKVAKAKVIKVILVYPGNEDGVTEGYFHHPDTSDKEIDCHVVKIAASKDISKWQKTIREKFMDFI